MSSQQRTLIVTPQIGIVAAGSTLADATSAFVVPTDTVNYADASVTRASRDGTGTYTPRVKRQKANKSYTITASGDLYYEILPYLFSAAYGNLIGGAPDSSPFTYDWNIGVTSNTNHSFMPYTSWITGVTSTEGTLEAARIDSTWIDTFTVSGNAQGGTLRYDLTKFGRLFTRDTDTTTPIVRQIEGRANEDGGGTASLGLCNPLDISIFTKDAAAAGDNFTSMTEMGCDLLDWSVTFTSRYRPLWAANGATAGYYCAAAYRIPSIVFNGVFLTDASTRAAIRERYLADTPLEFRLIIGPDSSSRQWTLDLTGHWSSVPSIHDDSDEIMVMNAEFTAESPSIQTSSYHWASTSIQTLWSYFFNAS